MNNIKLSLKELLKLISKKNLYGEVSMGKPCGKEVCSK